jgi:hypothetical protein
MPFKEYTSSMNIVFVQLTWGKWRALAVLVLLLIAVIILCAASVTEVYNAIFGSLDWARNFNEILLIVVMVVALISLGYIVFYSYAAVQVCLRDIRQRMNEPD